MIKMIFGKALAVTILMLFAGINLIPLIESTSFQNSKTSDSSHYRITDGYYTQYDENLRGRPDGLAPKTVRTQNTPQRHASLHDRGYFYGYNVYDPSGQHQSGPITFDTPDAIDLLAPGVFPNFCGGSDVSPSAGDWYGCDYAGGLYLIDTSTGSQTYIASTIGVNGMTYDGTTNTWYVSSSNSLYTMDVTNGQTTLIGSHNINNIVIGLACDDYGNIFAYDVLWNDDSTLYSVNKQTGECTAIGSMGYGFVYAQGCDYDGEYAVISIAGYFNDGSPSALLTCDPSTGVATKVAHFAGGMEVDGLVAPVYYPPPHDIAIKKINAPSSGNATSITPEVRVINSGCFVEDNVSINLLIGKEQINGTVEDFEATNGSYIHYTKLTDSWQYSTPTSGPMAAHSGSNLWATILSGDYPNSMWSGLTTQPFVVPSGVGFSFWHWYYFENSWDGGNVKITNDGGTTYTLLTPIGGYPGFLNSNPYMTGQAAYTGNGNGWKKAEFDLSAYEGQLVQIMWETASDSSVTYPGWYIDDVGFTITSWVNIYDQTVTIPSIAPDEVIGVAFPEWTPADLGLVENENINYLAEATNLFADQNTNNDYKAKPFTLHFGWFNDMKVNAINSPVNGLATPQTPEVAIENVGQFDQSANVNMVISKREYGSEWKVYNPNGGNTWVRDTTGPRTGTGDAKCTYEYTAVPNDDWLATPGNVVAPGGVFSFWVHGYTYNDDHYHVYLSTVGNTIDDFLAGTELFSGIAPPSTYTYQSFDLSVYEGQTVYCGIFYDGNYAWYIWVDDITLPDGTTEGFEGTAFPPMLVSLIPEYDATTMVSIDAGETLNVSLPEWTPADLPFATSIDYQSDASVIMNVSDGNPSDNTMSKMFTLSYEHDVGVIEITQPDWLCYLWDYPVEGIIQNFGVTYSELDIPVNAQFEIDDVVIYDETVIVQGPLDPGATTTVIFPNITIPIILPKTDFKLTMQTQLANDDHPENNKKIKTWYIPPPPDDIPPVTNATVSGNMGQNGWYVSNVQVTLIAVDFGGEWPMGVNTTYYSINDPDPPTWELYTTPIVIDDDCFHGKVYFYSDDKAIPPNVEEVKNVSFKIDQDPPIFTDYTFTPLNFMKDEWLCKATVEDSCSGIVLVEFYVDGTLIGSVTGEPYEFEFDGKPTNSSQAVAYDAAGNSALSPIAQYYEMNYQTRQSHQILGEENKNEI